MTRLEVCQQCEEAVNVDSAKMEVDCRVGKKCCGGSLSRQTVNLRFGKCNRDYWGVDLMSCFDRVYVVNLKRRPDRLADFWNRIGPDWPHRKPIVLEAIDGDKVGPPAGYRDKQGNMKNVWGAGGGAWGCMQSHRRILEDCLMADVQSVFIMEDDAQPAADYKNKIQDFMDHVPKDWDCLMIGGQHFKNGVITEPKPGVKIRKCEDCQRTHAYAVRGKCMKDLYRMWCSYDWHCDHALGPFMANYKTFSPEPFLIGQGRNVSDITCKPEPARFWSGADKPGRIAIIKCSRKLIDELRFHGIHTGHSRDPTTGIDVGLLAIAKSTKSPTEKKRELRKLIDLLRWEAAAFELNLCGIWFPEMPAEMRQYLHQVVGNDLMQINASSVEQFMNQWTNHANTAA